MHSIAQNQFGGSVLEDPYAHMDRFTMQVSPVVSEQVSLDDVRLTLFPHSLRDAAEEWLRAQPQQSIISWDDLAKKFSEKFFPSSRMRQLKHDINTFYQKESENLYDVWERFKGLLRKCSGHNLKESAQVDRFYAALNRDTRVKLDLAGKNGAFDHLSTKDSLEIINNLAEREAHSSYDRCNRGSVNEIQAYDNVMASNKALSDKMDAMFKRMDDRKMNTEKEAMDEEIKYLRSSRHDPPTGTYNPSWANHPSLSYRNQDGYAQQGNSKQYSNPQRGQYQDQRQQPQQDQNSGKRSLEDIVGKLAQTTESFMTETRNTNKNHEASLRNLENQMGQIAKQLSERSPGKLPSDTIENQANLSAITTRSGKILKDAERKIVKKRGDEVEKPKEENREVSEKKTINDKSEENKDKESTTFPNDKSCCKVPFPKALVKKNLEKQFSKFLEVFKKLQINIPFSEALEQMPTYSKFMKEILSRRRKLSEVDETIMMSEECSAILQRKLPQKMKDPGSFTLPVEIEGLPAAKALCDLGASINLMPLRLGLGEVTPTMINLQLADRSLKTPYGIIEDVLVRVDKFIFPVDFVILDMEEDTRIPLILGRPFLATGNAKINVRKGILSLKVGEEKVRFNVFESLKHRNDENIFSVEVVDEFV
ncbi:uncharacterized protein LOC130736091 [Lotus japonicus]|uniref:uncharacterized protein LOC130736091 n=1 Tax=Lotus japonicus TaxID=34305 RepID=UPI00258C6ADA|nr:uncharacterized protein LOC130736091 [Lotus japonicus]